MLAAKTLLIIAYHFLLLLVGFDTLTYQKELQLIPYTSKSSLCGLADKDLLEYVGANMSIQVPLLVIDRRCVSVMFT